MISIEAYENHILNWYHFVELIRCFFFDFVLRFLTCTKGKKTILLNQNKSACFHRNSVITIKHKLTIHHASSSPFYTVHYIIWFLCSRIIFIYWKINRIFYPFSLKKKELRSRKNNSKSLEHLFRISFFFFILWSNWRWTLAVSLMIPVKKSHLKCSISICSI